VPQYWAAEREFGAEPIRSPEVNDDDDSDDSSAASILSDYEQEIDGQPVFDEERGYGVVTGM
jgi:hypothetical protein